MSDTVVSTNGWKPNPRAARRRSADHVATAFGMVMAGILVLVLASILWTLLSRGLAGLSAAAIMKPMGPPGSSSGLANAIVGSLIQTFMALLMATPLGLGCGIYLSEYGTDTNKFASCVRFVSDVLMSVPSILVGLFVYQVMVAPFGHFSALAG
ncbi:phosphate transporter, partial [Gluconobacter albidus]